MMGEPREIRGVGQGINLYAGYGHYLVSDKALRRGRPGGGWS
jgi:hypothetical protein